MTIANLLNFSPTLTQTADAQMDIRPRWRLHLTALVFYTALAFIVLYTLVFTTGTHTAGYDYFNYNWNFWWIRHALHTPGLNVYENNFVMFPAVSNYGYHALTAFWYPVWALLEPLIGTLTVVNLIIVAVCILNGYLLFVLLRGEGVAAPLALLGGAALQTLPISRYWYFNTHLNLMDWFWLPALLLMWRQIAGAVEAKRLRALLVWTVMMGAALWGLLLTDLQFPIFATTLVVPYGLLTLVRAKRRMLLIAAGLLTVAVAFALVWFAGPLPYILRFQGELTPGPAEDRPGIPFPGGLLSMAEGWWNWDRPSTGAFFTVTVLLALLVSHRRIWRRAAPRAKAAVLRDRWFWFAVMLPPLILALGPTLWIGATAVPLPYRLMHEVTDGMFRMPWRLAPAAVIAGMLFAGKTLTPVIGAWRARPFPNPLPYAVFAGALLLLAGTVRLGETAPLQTIPYPYTFYQQMGRERGEAYDDYTVVEVPTGAGTGEVLLGSAQGIQLQWYGMTHGKRMVNGFISRAPIDSFWYLVYDDPMLSWLGQRRALDPDAVAAQMRDRIFNWPIGYFVIHKNLIGTNTPALQEIIGFFNTQDDLVCPFAIEHNAIAYRTRWHPDGCPLRTPPESTPGVYTVDLGAAVDERYLGLGWHWPEEVAGLTLRWAGANPQARLYVDLPPGRYALELSAQAFWEARELRVLINGVQVGVPVTVAVDTLRPYAFVVPAEVIGDGQHLEITLDYDTVVVPNEVGQSADARRLSIAVDWLRLTRTASGT